MVSRISPSSCKCSVFCRYSRYLIFFLNLNRDFEKRQKAVVSSSQAHLSSGLHLCLLLKILVYESSFCKLISSLKISWPPQTPPLTCYSWLPCWVAQTARSFGMALGPRGILTYKAFPILLLHV